jgi:hypothetical protein
MSNNPLKMILDIKRTILRKNLSNFISLILLTLIIIGLLFIPARDLIKGLENSLLAIFCAIAYVIYSFYNAFRNYHYIYFNDESDKIVLRYFSPNIFTSKKNSIEIPKKDFAGFVIDSFFLRYREKITLLRRTGKGIAKYPPVSLTALGAHERDLLLHALGEWKRKSEK